MKDKSIFLLKIKVLYFLRKKKNLSNVNFSRRVAHCLPSQYYWTKESLSQNCRKAGIAVLAIFSNNIIFFKIAAEVKTPKNIVN